MYSLIGFIANNKLLGTGVVTKVSPSNYVTVKFDKDGKELEFSMDIFMGYWGDYFLHSAADVKNYEKNEHQKTNELTNIKKKINTDIILILVNNNDKKCIDFDFIDIYKPLNNTLVILTKICGKQTNDSTLDEIESFLNANPDFCQLHGKYRYCVSLSLPFQGVEVDIFNLYYQIQTLRKDLVIRKKNRARQQELETKNITSSPNANYDIDMDDGHEDYFDINNFKNKFIENATLWCEANAIHKAYRHCYNNKNILTFSHRICGWSNPIHQLTENFSVELKTNFGYGQSSYFYTKLRYKNIEIVPFSDWIKYENANAFEIIRYTQNYKLENEYWYDALMFAKDACNISLKDECQFVRMYIIEECEKMVNGLIDIINNDHYIFKDVKSDKKFYEKDLEGRVLITFRGEKITGALNFISKIIELGSIIDVCYFISKIEVCNKLIQPVLANELINIDTEVQYKYSIIRPLKEEYTELATMRNYYFSQQDLMRDEYIKNNMINETLDLGYDFDFSKIENEFNSKFPEFKKFICEYKELGNNISILEQQICHLKDTYEVIRSYNSRIIYYFDENEKLNTLTLVS